jgi:hypothetical protein
MAEEWENLMGLSSFCDAEARYQGVTGVREGASKENSCGVYPMTQYSTIPYKML